MYVFVSSIFGFYTFVPYLPNWYALLTVHNYMCLFVNKSVNSL